MSGVRIANKDTRVLERLTFESEKVLKVRAFALRDTISSVLERSKVGRSTVLGPKNPRSLPGDPPARQAGTLVNSISATKVTPTLYEVGPAAQPFVSRGDYPVFLEFGTRNMAPRPFVRPGILEFKRKLR
jgi:hypothetical protein